MFPKSSASSDSQKSGDALEQLPSDWSWKEKLAYLAYRMKALADKEFPVGHMFMDGQYVREVQYPAGTLIIGRTHLLGHECRLLSGTVVLIQESLRTSIGAPYVLHTKPGFQMVVYCVTAITAVTLHPNPGGSRNIDELEAKWFAPESETLELGAAVHLRMCHKDYEHMLEGAGEAGRTLEILGRTVADLVPFPESVNVEVRKSRIQGDGLFATRAIEVNATIAPMSVGMNRTAAGRFTNHSHEPNAEAYIDGGDLYLRSRTRIPEGDEVTVDYRQVVEVSQEKIDVCRH